MGLRMSDAYQVKALGGSKPRAAVSAQVFERDDGLYEVGMVEPLGPFETRQFAEAVAFRETGDPPDKRRRPAAGTAGRYSLVWDAASSTRYATVPLLTSAVLR